MQISYLADHPEFIPVLAPAIVEHWHAVRPEETSESRVARLRNHLSRDTLPIAWVAHVGGQVLGAAALRVHDLEDRRDLSPWQGRRLGAAGISAIRSGIGSLPGGGG